MVGPLALPPNLVWRKVVAPRQGRGYSVGSRPITRTDSRRFQGKEAARRSRWSGEVSFNGRTGGSPPQNRVRAPAPHPKYPWLNWRSARPITGRVQVRLLRGTPIEVADLCKRRWERGSGAQSRSPIRAVYETRPSRVWSSPLSLSYPGRCWFDSSPIERLIRTRESVSRVVFQLERKRDSKSRKWGFESLPPCRRKALSTDALCRRSLPKAVMP